MEVREAVCEIKELLMLYPKFIVSGKNFVEIEIGKGCNNIILCQNEHYCTKGSPSDKIFNLMYRALHGGLDEGIGKLKTEEMYDLHKFLKESKIIFKTG